MPDAAERSGKGTRRLRHCKGVRHGATLCLSAGALGRSAANQAEFRSRIHDAAGRAGKSINGALFAAVAVGGFTPLVDPV